MFRKFIKRGFFFGSRSQRTQYQVWSESFQNQDGLKKVISSRWFLPVCVSIYAVFVTNYAR